MQILAALAFGHADLQYLGSRSKCRGCWSRWPGVTAWDLMKCSVWVLESTCLGRKKNSESFRIILYYQHLPAILLCSCPNIVGGGVAGVAFAVFVEFGAISSGKIRCIEKSVFQKASYVKPLYRDCNPLRYCERLFSEELIFWLRALSDQHIHLLQYKKQP